MHTPRTISLIAWDLDNTLYDRNGAMRRFFERWLAAQFPPSRWAGMLAEILAADEGGDADRLEFCARMLEIGGRPRSGAAALWAQIQREILHDIALQPQVPKLLRELATHYRMAILTNGSGAFQRGKIRALGLEEWFAPELIIASGEVGVDKPDPRIFQALFAATKCAPGEVLMVGDHPEKDIAGAAALGAHTCWVSLNRARPANLAADFVVTQVWELARLLPRREPA